MSLRKALKPRNLWVDLKDTTTLVIFGLLCLMCVLAIESAVKLMVNGFINWIF
jgi:hypothetical protein